VKIPLYKNEEWIAFAENMFMDNDCFHIYIADSPLWMFLTFAKALKLWYVKVNKNNELTDFRRYRKVRDIIWDKYYVQKRDGKLNTYA